MSRFALCMVLVWILFATTAIFAMDTARDGILLSPDGTELGSASVRRWEIDATGGIAAATIEWVAWTQAEYEVAVALRNAERHLVSCGLTRTPLQEQGTYNTVVPFLGKPVDASVIASSAVTVRVAEEG
ncbi:MAG: hypothetical protein FJ039_08480 [Chloroflexi bacterium]|nr:hypothetical protein [Chloroflexota bacterium]